MIFAVATTILWLFTLLVIALTFLPMTKLPHGAIQSMGFLRIQTLAVTILTAAAAFFVIEGPQLWWLVGILALSGLVNAIYIAKFTPIWRVQSQRPETPFSDLDKRTVSILASNVKLSNRDYDRFNTMVHEEDPDILIAVEVDQDWLDNISEVTSRYPIQIQQPLNTGYGMAVYSRLPMQQIRVADLVTEGVPSIRAAVQLPIGAWFRLYAVHPEPPVPNLETKGRDSEIALAGLEAKADPLPAIIAGDLNDVAWSTTTRRFQRLSGLLDPRVGRGFYSTFNALVPVFRWPLDHLFHDAKFRLIEMRRLPGIGSDHFPMLFSLALSESAGDSDLPDPPRSGEKEEVKEMIEDAKADDRSPIGTDWEDG